MIVLIPIATGQQINEKVFEGLKKQSISCIPIICESNGVINSQRIYSNDRLKGEELSRKKCQEEAKKYNDKYVLLMDSDCVLTDRLAIQEMIDFLEKNDKINAVSLYFGFPLPESTKLHHVGIRCCLIKREIFININLTFRYEDVCFCNTIKRECSGKMEYLDYKTRAYEIL